MRKHFIPSGCLMVVLLAAGPQARAAESYTVSGVITLNGNPLAGVTVSDGTNWAGTNSSGSYSITESGAYTLTPSLFGYAFSPATQSGTVNGGDVSNVNFTAASSGETYTISGTVTLNGNPLAGANVTDGFQSVTTDASGDYSLTEPNGIYYELQAYDPLFYTFNPIIQDIRVNGANVTGVNITATPITATPVFSPPPGAYAGPQTVTISCATSGALIQYTTIWGSELATCPAYTGPITISSTTCLQAMASSDGAQSSLTPTVVYNIAGSSNYNIGITSDTYTDTDGNGFPDEIKTALGISLTNPAATPFNLPVNTTTEWPAQSLTVTKLSVKLNFAKTSGNDSIQVSGLLPIPDGFAANSQTVLLDVGGVVKIFTLNSKGIGAPASGYPAITSATNDHFSLKFKSQKGNVPAQTGSFTAQFNKGTFAGDLADEGLLGNMSVKKYGRVVPVIVMFNAQMFEELPVTQYTATANKTGVALWTSKP
jgi:hypothetical protein